MRNFNNLRNNFNAKQGFDAIRISLLSPEKTRSRSYGEVEKPDTVNYRTNKPENGGLFCAKIFGPVKDYECICGKYKRMKYRGVVCEKCGVEVTTSKVRRERMGHIELATPIVHIWFLRSLPSRISMLLDLMFKDVEKVLYFESYIVYDPGVTTFHYGQLLTEQEYYDAQDEFGEDAFKAGTGAEVIKQMLASLDLEALYKTLRTELDETSSEVKRKKIVKRLKLVEDFLESGNKPEWMVLEVLPVIPPDLRPLVMLDGGRFATSDLNELYRRVINRNNRLARLIELKAPDIIVRNEKRMLQEVVDALFDNSRKSKSLKNANKRPYKSLADMLKGKQGRFRQNLLGKRVDYSGRSVIVVGPNLKLHQCGIPKKMALELFKPFIYQKLQLHGYALTLKAAKYMVDAEKPEVWDVLEEVIKKHPILLNRAPTLHRLGIQAFEPLLIEGKAIQLHPLVCTAFNADFDGDQMAVHVPLSIEAQLEARVLMMSSNNVLSPANGRPIIVPTQDIILGLYYITSPIQNEIGDGKLFLRGEDIEYALHSGVIKINTLIKYRITFTTQDGVKSSKIVETTAGRVFMSEILPKNENITFDMVNKVMNKKEVSNLIDTVYRYCGQKATVIFADHMMSLGFKWACRSGISIGKDDMIVPASKKSHIDNTLKEVAQYENQYSEGLITTGEKYNKIVDAWSRCSDQITEDMMTAISGKNIEGESIEKSIKDFDPKKVVNVEKEAPKPRLLNSIYMMADSGARGSAAQIKQLAAMRGLMTRPSGEIIETPIISNFKEGLSVLEAFISTHGARKGAADTALRTANSGYLTRKLVDVAQDSIVNTFDCGSEDGIVMRPSIENSEVSITLGDKILGRVSVTDIYDQRNGAIILKKGDLIDEAAIEKIEESGIDSVKVRSVITCKNKTGVCAQCYGRDLATGHLVNIGEAIGVIAAQSIGEPGTQLTMRTFHIGGAAQKTTLQSYVAASSNGTVRFLHKNIVENSNQQKIAMSRNCEAVIYDEKENEKGRYKVPYGARILVDDGAYVTIGTKIADWDPFTIPIITEKSGTVKYVDLIDQVTMKEMQDDMTGMANRVVTHSKRSMKGGEDLRPRIMLVGNDGEVLTLANGLEARYFLPVDALLNVDDGEVVSAGDIIARIPKESSKSKDITGGLPRVVELFEARNPKDQSIISEINGYVEFAKDYKSKRRVIIRSSEDKEKFVEYFIPRGKHIIVNEGDMVSKGDLLMEGSPSLHDILRIMGIEALAHYMVEEIQQVYRLQGVVINDKHIEVILGQMLKKVEVIEHNGTTLLMGEQVDREEFNAINEKAIKMGYKPARAIPILQGITKAALQTQSFFSAASFQETTRILTEAAVAGKVDHLKGLKENVIVGNLIPAGTGLYHQQIKKIAVQRDREFLIKREELKRKKEMEDTNDAANMADEGGASAAEVS